MPAEMQLAEAARIMREATKDKSYQLFPMGQEAAGYLRAKRKRLTDSSYRDYERGLDKFARYFPDLELKDFERPVGTVRVEEFLEAQYGGSSPRNYNKNLSILSDFFKYQYSRDFMRSNPTVGIERAKERQPYRTTFSSDDVKSIIASAESRRDRIALRLLLFYGIRKGALAAVQFKHFDHQRKKLTIFTKGQKIRDLPLPDPHLWMDLERLMLDQASAPGDYLMCRRRMVPYGPPDVYDRRATHYIEWHDSPMSSTALHRWWYQRLTDAGVVPVGTQAGERMHKARHTAGQRLLDGTHGNLQAVKKLLGHSSISTTADIYTDWDDDQLAASLAEVLADDA